MARARTRYSVRRTSAIAGTDIYDRNFDAIAATLEELGTSLEWVVRGGSAGAGGAGGGGGAPIPPAVGTLSGFGHPTRIAFWTGSYALGDDFDLWWNNANKCLGVGTETPESRIHAYKSDTTANALTDLLTLQHTHTLSGPLAGFGASVLFRGQGTSGAASDLGRFGAKWVTATTRAEDSAFTWLARKGGAGLTEIATLTGGPISAGRTTLSLGDTGATHADARLTLGSSFVEQLASGGLDVMRVVGQDKMQIGVGGATAAFYSITLDNDGNSLLTSIGTNDGSATHPWPAIQQNIAPPTGVPTVAAGGGAITLDRANHRFYWYENQGASIGWHYVQEVAGGLPPVGGTGVSPRVAYWNGTNSITSAAGFLFSSPGQLQMGLASTTTGSLKLGNASSTHYTTLQGGNATHDVIYVLPTDDAFANYVLATDGGGTLSWITAASLAGGSALTRVDDTNLTLTLGGTPLTALLAATSLTLGWTGQLAVPRGGTGLATVTLNGVMYGNGTSAVGITAQGGTRTMLTANAGAPAWSAAPILNTSIQLGVESSTTGSLKLAHASSVNLTTITAGNASTASTYVWPTTVPGGNGYALTSTTGGTLSWTALTVGTVTGTGTAGRLALWDSTTNITNDAGFLWSTTGPTLTLSGTAPKFIMTDTTASAKSLTITTDANLTKFAESAAATTGIFTIDWANSRVGVNNDSPSFAFHILSAANAQVAGSVKTSSASGGAQANWRAENATYIADFGMLGTGYTTAGAFVANLGYVYGNAPAGFAVFADNAAGLFQVFTGASNTTPKFTIAASASGIATIQGTAPALVMTDTTASAKSLTVTTDANLTTFVESGATSTYILTLDLANNRVGLNTNAPSGPFHIASTANSNLVALCANTNTSTAGNAIWRVASSAYVSDMRVNGTGFTTDNLIVASQNVLYGDSTGGWLLAAKNATGTFQFTTGNGYATSNLRLKINETGDVTIGNTSTTTASKTTIQTRDTGTTTQLEALRLQRLTSGTAAAALGVFATNYVDNASATAIEAARFTTKWSASTTAPSAGTETSAWYIDAYQNGSSVNLLAIGGLRVDSAAGAALDACNILPAKTAVITGSTNITNATGFNVVRIDGATYSSASALTITNAATLYIKDAPVAAGGGAGKPAITNAYSIWIDSGMPRIDGKVTATWSTRLPALYGWDGSTGPTTTDAGPVNYVIDNYLPIVVDGTQYWLGLMK